LQIDEGRDRTIVKQFVATVVDATFAKREAFGFEPQLVVT
jgi:hypothetical protein